MKNKNLKLFTLILATLAVLSSACGFLKSSSETQEKKAEVNTAPANTNPANTKTPEVKTESKTEEKKGVVSPSDTADFTFKAEDLFKEYEKDKNPIKGEKYVNKIIEVSGRLEAVDLEKKVNGAYKARLKAGGMFDWVSCGVDEESKEQFAKLKEDQQVTFKGLGDRFWIGGPGLAHCVVVEEK